MDPSASRRAGASSRAAITRYVRNRCRTVEARTASRTRTRSSSRRRCRKYRPQLIRPHPQPYKAAAGEAAAAAFLSRARVSSRFDRCSCTSRVVAAVLGIPRLLAYCRVNIFSRSPYFFASVRKRGRILVITRFLVTTVILIAPRPSRFSS